MRVREREFKTHKSSYEALVGENATGYSISTSILYCVEVLINERGSLARMTSGGSRPSGLRVLLVALSARSLAISRLMRDFDLLFHFLFLLPIPSGETWFTHRCERLLHLNLKPSLVFSPFFIVFSQRNDNTRGMAYRCRSAGGYSLR